MTGTALALVLLAHFFGDYVLQSHWMATRKTTAWLPAFIHATVYTACYTAATHSAGVLLVIGVTHAIIDRYRLARHVSWLSNHLAPRSAWPEEWNACRATGYDPSVPVWLAVWLMIVTDNAMHIAINISAILLLT